MTTEIKNFENITLLNQEDLNNLIVKLKVQEKKVNCFCGGSFIAKICLIDSHINSKKHLYFLENNKAKKIPEIKKQEYLFEPHFQEFDTYFSVTFQLKCKKTKEAKFEFNEKNKDKKQSLALKYFEHVKFKTDILNQCIREKKSKLDIK